jgi:hypothetical protein
LKLRCVCEVKGRPNSRPFLLADFQSNTFIGHSQNKPDGTADIAEHRASPFVVGAGNANTEEISP